MMKIFAGLVAVIVVATGGYFGLETYVQQRVTGEIETVFANLRAAGAKATHGKVTFSLWSRTVTVDDIAGESATQPPWRVKIGRFSADGLNPSDTRFTAGKIDVANLEVDGTLATPSGLRLAYRAPRIEVADYSGPAGPLRTYNPASPEDTYRFMIEHFAAMTATAITAPALSATITGAQPGLPGTGEYGYTGVTLRDLKDGKVATMTIDKLVFAANVDQKGKTEKLAGEVAGLAAYDFDATAAATILDPARAKDDRYYRVYRQMTAGTYTATASNGMRMRLEGMQADDIGVRPSRLQWPQLIAIIEQAPARGAASPDQLRGMLGKAAGIYEGLRIGSAELRGLTMQMPEGPFRLAAIRLSRLENGTLGEFSLEGLDGTSPQGPVKVARFALKSLDIANLLRMSAQFSNGQPSPDQLVGLLALLEGAEIKGVTAPYKAGTGPVTIDTMNLNWGQFVGPIPTRVRLTVDMSGPIDANDPDPFKMLVAAGMKSANLKFDLGASWNEGTKLLALEPVTMEVGNLFTAAARVSATNVPRQMFSFNPVQAAIMAAQAEAGTIEIALRDIGLVELAIAQQARTQKTSPEAARRAMLDNVRNTGMAMAAANPDAMAIAGAIVRFIETPRGTLNVKLTPKGKVPLMQVIDTLRSDPLAALARFQVEATNGR